MLFLMTMLLLCRCR